MRASRPISVLGALPDALLVKAFSTVDLAFACSFIALNDLSYPLIVRLAMLPRWVPDGS
jgi:hypothetical protein